MTVDAHPALPPAAAAVRGRVGDQWALAVTLTLLAGILAVAARSEQPTAVDGRLGRRVELIDLIGVGQARNAVLAAQVEDLSAQVGAFQEGSATTTNAVAALQDQLSAVSAAAGMTVIEGPGLMTTLTDSPLETSPSGDLNDLVVHEQDLQAVINALWAGGAEAMSVNGQRVLATTAIRCVGNTLLLHGRVYSPPYVIAAVGDAEAMRTALDADATVQTYAAAAAVLELGYDVASQDEIVLPAYEGTTAMAIAEPADRPREEVGQP